jgi:hypothetical protein
MMDVPIVESLEDYIEHAADALPHNMEASNAAREALGLVSAAINGADALEASLASESAGVFTISFGVLCMATVSLTHARTRVRTQKTSRTLALHSSDAKAMAMAQSAIEHS